MLFKRTAIYLVISMVLISNSEAAVKSKPISIPGIENEEQLMKETYEEYNEVEDGRNIRPISQRGELKIARPNESYDHSLDMRAKRRVGLAAVASGQTGAYGLQVELNFAADNSAVIGFGGGPRYSSYQFGWKHVFGGEKLSLYSNLGLAHWTSSRTQGQIENTTPGYLGSKLLSQEEKITGRFNKTFLTPSIGTQFYLLSGPYVGVSLFAEIVMMMDLEKISPIPTGAVGLGYLF